MSETSVVTLTVFKKDYETVVSLFGEPNFMFSSACGEFVDLEWSSVENGGYDELIELVRTHHIPFFGYDYGCPLHWPEVIMVSDGEVMETNISSEGTPVVSVSVLGTISSKDKEQLDKFLKLYGTVLDMFSLPTRYCAGLANSRWPFFIGCRDLC